MSDVARLIAFLDGAAVDETVFALRPDYRALLLAVDGIAPGPSDDLTEASLREAEASARDALAKTPVEELPHIAAWREAYRAFGAKPQRTRNSAEALIRRAAAAGLPRVNRLTDLYNAISVRHRLPLGGEDLTRYAGPPRLGRANGQESFETAADGEVVVEHPEPGEVIWYDDAGVTCRRWNWRQARRTQLSESTTTALFILDALDPLTDDALDTAATELVDQLGRYAPELTVVRRILATRPGPASVVRGP